MNAQEIKEKIINGQLSDADLTLLLKAKTNNRKKTFIQTLLRGFIDGYTTPALWKVIIESLLILTIIVASVMLAYADKMDTTVTSALLSATLGFLFGKIR